MKTEIYNSIRIHLFPRGLTRQTPGLPLLAALILFAILLVTLFGNDAYGHRLNVFALEENGDIIVESNFGAKRPAKNAVVTVRPIDSDEILLTGQTDERGRFVFTAPANAESGLAIIVNAGQGHQGRWELQPLRQNKSRLAAPATDPGFVEIIGGISCIIGLFGLFLWIRSLRKTKSGSAQLQQANTSPGHGKAA